MESKQTKDFIVNLNEETLLDLLSSLDIGKAEVGSDFDIDKWFRLMEEHPTEIVKSEASLEESVEVLCKALKEDKDYYRAWSDSIAMAFYDEFYNTGSVKDNFNSAMIHEIVNNAADNFLKQLIKETVREEYLITQEKENEVFDLLALNIQLSLAITHNFKLNVEDTLILNVSPDYSSIISQKLSHQFSSPEGEIMDVLNINVPYPDETDMTWYNTKIDSLLKELSNMDYTNFIFVEAGIIRGSNYKWIKEKFTKQYNSKNLLFCALFENINSKFKSDCVGEYYNDKTQDLTFYWEKFNKHFK